MDDFWGAHWWLIIFLLAMLFPLFGMVMSAMVHRDYARHRREALETLKIYANQGKDPPPEVVDALTGFGWGGRRWRRQWRDAGVSAAGAAAQTDWYEGRAAHLVGRWRAREPFRRWHNAFFMVALTTGLYVASKEIHDAVIADRFLVAAIIVGALAAASVLSALLVTVFRPK